MQSVRVHFDGRVLVPEEPLNLVTGASLVIQILPPSASVLPGSPVAVIAATYAPPRLNAADIEELEAKIASSKLPLAAQINLDASR